MIDYIVGGEYLNVTSHKGAMPYINMSSQQPMIGAMSFDANSQNMKVYDGMSWQTLGGGNATVNLNANAISILKWAEKKMREEMERDLLAVSNPAVKDLIKQIEEKEDQIKVIQTLLREEVKIATS